MITWLRHHARAAARAVQRLVRSPLVTLGSVSAIGITLALPLGLYLALLQMKGVVGALNTEPELTMFLAVDATPTDVQAVTAKLKLLPAVAAYRFVSRDDAWREMRETAGLREATEGLPGNPLPHAFVVQAVSDTPEALEALRAALAVLPKVEHVQGDFEWARRLAAFHAAGQKVVGLLAAVLGVALVAVIGNTIRLQVLTQREEIEIGRLIGATSAYVRRPYLYLGALQGALAGLVAVGLGWLAWQWLARNLAALAGSSSAYPGAAHLPVIEALSLAGAAALLGWLGAYASVFLYLRMADTAAKGT